MNIALAKYIGLGLLLVLGAGGALVYFNSTNAPASENGNQETSGQQGPSENGSFSGSLSALVARGGNWQCSFEHTVEGIRSSGTVYISGSSLRGDFASAVPQLSAPVESHMIQDGGYVYVWNSLVPQGFKTKSAAGASASGASSGGVDINQQLDYTCMPWTKDASKFAIPAGIEFIGN